VFFSKPVLRNSLNRCNVGSHSVLNSTSELAYIRENSKGYNCDNTFKTENKFMKYVGLILVPRLLLALFLIYLQVTLALPAGYEAYAQMQDLARRYNNSTYPADIAQAAKNSTKYSGSSSNISMDSNSNSNSLISSYFPLFTEGPQFSFPNRPLNESNSSFSATPAPPAIIYNPFEESQSRVIRLDKNSTILESSTSYALNHSKDLSFLSGANPNSGNNGYLDLISPWFPSIPAVYCKGMFKLIIEGKISPILSRNHNVELPSNKEIRIEINSSDKLPLGNPASNTRTISGNVTISSNLTRNNQDSETDQGISSNSDLSIDRIFNNCQTLAYAKGG
jgi:hypothetical protein